MEKKHECKTCGARFYCQSLLSSHVIKRYENKPKHTCSLCGKSYPRLYSLKRHACEKAYSIKDNRPDTTTFTVDTSKARFLCSVCGRTYTAKWTLDRHMISHSTERPFSCETCRKTFKCSKNLIDHKLTHDDNLGFSCDICEKKFRYKSNLKQHMYIHGPEHVKRERNQKLNKKYKERKRRKLMDETVNMPSPHSK